MASEYRQLGTYTLTIPAGGTRDVTTALSTADWTKLMYQIDVLASTAAASTDITAQWQTAMTTDNFAKWSTCGAAVSVSKTGYDSSVGDIDWSTGHLSRFAKLTATNTTGGPITLTVQVSVLLKERAI